MRIVLFDMMDTLIHEPYFRAMGRLLPDPADVEEFKRWREVPAFIEFESGEISEQEYFRRFFLPDTPPEIHARMPRPEKIKKEILRELEYRAGIRELLARLREREDVRVGIASNYGEWYREILKRLADLGRADYFFFSCEMGVRKPDSAYYAVIQSALQEQIPDLSGERIFFIDDREVNLAAARDFGWRTHLAGEPQDLEADLRDFLGGL